MRFDMMLVSLGVLAIFLATGCNGSPASLAENHPGPAVEIGRPDEPTAAPPQDSIPPFLGTPPPTRLPLTGFTTVDYDPSYPPSDLAAGRFASIGPDGEIYLVEIASGEREQVTNDGYRKRDAVLSGDYVAWIDERRQIPIYDSGHVPPEGFADDIFLYNLATRELKRITDVPARRSGLRISGQRLVWVDNRNELQKHYTDADIYAYDIVTGEERPVAVAAGSQRNPSIEGDLVVWQDNRNSPALGSGLAGCGSCPENRFDIYLYDFRTGKEEALIESAFLKQGPSIDGTSVVWQDSRNGGEPDIYLLDIGTRKERRLTDGRSRPHSPLISGERVVWVVRSACDVLPHPSNRGVFAYDLRSGVVTQLSNYIEPAAMMRGEVVLITEACFVASRVYAVFLEE